MSIEVYIPLMSILKMPNDCWMPHFKFDIRMAPVLTERLKEKQSLPLINQNEQGGFQKVPPLHEANKWSIY